MRNYPCIYLKRAQFPAKIVIKLMLRRTLSSLASTSSAVLIEQENEVNFESSILPTPSPNRLKYEGKFNKAREQRRPLIEKTNNCDKNSPKVFKKPTEESNTINSSITLSENKTCEKSKKEEAANTSSNVSFQDLFHLTSSIASSNGNGNTTNISNSTGSKVEELSMALSETLKENEELHDTISLLKAEIERLNEELSEHKEYAELYLLSKELIENQNEEIENLKKKLVKRE